MSRKIAFIGLGIMGQPMARNLLKAGHRLVVYDLTSASVEKLVAAGAARAGSAQDAAARSDLILTMLPDGPDVEKAILGPGGVLEGARRGAYVVDMSSISPMVSQKAGAACERKGVEFLDAPVSGGEPKAIDGTLAIMVGGNADAFEHVRPVLEAMGSSVTLTGPVGAGNVTKLANQIIVALNIAAMSEALVLGTKAGVDPELIYNAIRGGLAGSNVLEAKALRVMDNNFEPGFKIDLHVKDLANALETARQVGVPLFLTAQVMEILKSLQIEGKGQKDHSGILLFYEKMAQIQVRRRAEQDAEKTV
jgi:2-hydroxy-3-oxopropionate reductase